MTPHLRLDDGVFLGRDAVAGGLLRPDDLRHHRRLLRGVYADPRLPFDHDTRCRGAALLLPEGYVVGGLSAVGWYADPLLGPVDPVTAVGPDGPTWRGPLGIRVHRSDLASDDVVVDRRGVPVTTPLRTAWDVAALEPLVGAVAALDRLAHVGAVDLVDLLAWAETRRGKWGVTRVREAIAWADRRAESPPESRTRVCLVRAGLTPEVQFEVLDVDGVFLARVDLAFPDLKIAVEYEGAHHFDPDQIRRDEQRLARLRAAGWVVLRLANADLYDMDGVVRRIQDVIAERTAARR